MYKFQADETIADGFTRILIEKAEENLDFIHYLPDKPIRNVHSIRKNIKRSRAILRLARYSISEETYRSENNEFRNLGRLLSDVRDRAVLLETLEDVFPKGETSSLSSLENDVIVGLKSSLRQAASNAYGELVADEDLQIKLKVGFEARRLKWKSCDADVDSEAIKQGYLKVYRDGRKLMKAALSEWPTPIVYHEWRKQVKYLLYHHQLLAQLFSSVKDLNEMTYALDHLAELLGKAHDAHVLTEWLSEQPAGEMEEQIIRRAKYKRLDYEGASGLHGKWVFRQKTKRKRRAFA